MSTPRIPRLFCLVDQGHLERPGLLPRLAEVGVGGFQVRAKGLDDSTLLTLAGAVIDAVRSHGAMVIVNDRVDIALAAGADGVHLGRDDLPVPHARRIAPDLIIGATCRSRQHAVQAAADGADYAGFGPIRTSTSKVGLPAPLGFEALRAAAGPLPLVGIGGLGVDDAARVRAAGGHGMATIAAIWEDADPVAAAGRLVNALAVA
ncbi:thiamine phosphate synthase [Nocardioides limicola]|uniref:thiamine phosphate synthase n=1 Tax=Nocardioides limicola TaxID=2803368 RepID=UPI00193C662D|nr:thiamine phosphate synthase [Nocardioides sp. DJM-14]